ncbi:hypothetical protein HDU85_004252 [Gaertneriomyces sp. JEL0708]|nr:hypothetical protein HDU85_004252 [Gaertneriomyces sp. JEL0708]
MTAAAAPLRFGDFSPLRSCAPPPASFPPSGSFGMFSTGRKRAWDALDDNLPVTSIPDYSLRPHNGPKRLRTLHDRVPLKFGVKRRLEENEADTDDDIIPVDLHPAHKRSRISDVTDPASPITPQATSNVYTNSLPTPVADTPQLALIPYRSSCATSPSLHINEYLRKHLSEVSGDTDIMRDWSRLPSPASGEMVLYNGGRWTPPEIEDVGVCRIEELPDEEPPEEAESSMMDLDE